MRRQQKAVEDVEALRGAVAVGPGLDVAGAEELGHREASDRTTAVPVFQQTAAEDVLTDALDYQAFGFRRPWQVRGFVVEDTEQRVRQRARELERAAQQGWSFAMSLTLSAPAAPLGTSW